MQFSLIFFVTVVYTNTISINTLSSMYRIAIQKKRIILSNATNENVKSYE